MAETKKHLIVLTLVPYATNYTLLSDVVGAVQSGLYERAISLTTLEAVTIMNRFSSEMSWICKA